MSTTAYKQVVETPARDRLDLFLATANRLGAPVGNIEKDFWVCWTLNALYHERPAGAPRLLFKGGTSLSKAYGLIQRFSEDIDITVFRDDLDEPASVEELEALSNKKRRARLDAIRDACRAYITGPLRELLAEQLADLTGGVGRIEIDEADPDGQTLLVWYPEVEPRDGAYVRPAVRIESGAKSALDPIRPVTIRPYIADEASSLDLAVADVTTVEATRTFWDKVVIAHGLRRWYERRGVLRQEGQRVSRHYYDLHCLLNSDVGLAALGDFDLGADCVRHARMFFNRPDMDLASAMPGTFALPKSWFNDLVDRALVRYGKIYIIQPYREQEICARACQEALGHECQCSCMGANHGAGNDGSWFEVSDTFSTRWGDRELACRLLTARQPATDQRLNTIFGQ